MELGWHKPGFVDSAWETYRYSTGPYWLCLDQLPADITISDIFYQSLENLQPNKNIVKHGNRNLEWTPVSFSKTISLNHAAPWGGHSGYPDGHIDKKFYQY